MPNAFTTNPPSVQLPAQGSTLKWAAFQGRRFSYNALCERTGLHHLIIPHPKFNLRKKHAPHSPEQVESFTRMVQRTHGLHKLREEAINRRESYHQPEQPAATNLPPEPEVFIVLPDEDENLAHPVEAPAQTGKETFGEAVYRVFNQMEGAGPIGKVTSHLTGEYVLTPRARKMPKAAIARLNRAFDTALKSARKKVPPFTDYFSAEATSTFVVLKSLWEEHALMVINARQ